MAHRREESASQSWRNAWPRWLMAFFCSLVSRRQCIDGFPPRTPGHTRNLRCLQAVERFAPSKSRDKLAVWVFRVAHIHQHTVKLGRPPRLRYGLHGFQQFAPVGFIGGSGPSVAGRVDARSTQRASTANPESSARQAGRCGERRCGLLDGISTKLRPSSRASGTPNALWVRRSAAAFRAGC